MSDGHNARFGSNHLTWPTKYCLAGLNALRLGEKSTKAFPFLHGKGRACLRH
jgi:hypothetical protein